MTILYRPGDKRKRLVQIAVAQINLQNAEAGISDKDKPHLLLTTSVNGFINKAIDDKLDTL